jgi:hypothetical protein
MRKQEIEFESFRVKQKNTQMNAPSVTITTQTIHWLHVLDANMAYVEYVCGKLTSVRGVVYSGHSSQKKIPII